MHYFYRYVLITIIYLAFSYDTVAKENIDLYGLYSDVYQTSKKLQKDSYSLKQRENFYEKFFYDDINLLHSALGISDLGDCGVLYLKKPCYLLKYKTEQELVNGSIGCLNIYARHLEHPEKYLIQDFVLFKKISGKWKILGNRAAVIELQDFAYQHFKMGRKVKEMFPNQCDSLDVIEMHKEKFMKNRE